MDTKAKYDVSITVIRIVNHFDLSKIYENEIEHTCSYHEGDVFYSIKGKKPTNFCPEAWKSLRPFVVKLACGESNFFDGWMKNPFQAMISCNDGFRPVSFLIERIN